MASKELPPIVIVPCDYIMSFMTIGIILLAAFLAVRVWRRLQKYEWMVEVGLWPTKKDTRDGRHAKPRPFFNIEIMEDQVSFKVFTYWSGGANPEVRRFGVDRSVVTSYTYLLAKIHDVFPKLKEKKFSVAWKDEDGDYVKISSDEEIMTMLTEAPAQLLKLTVVIENEHGGVECHPPQFVHVSLPDHLRSMPFKFASYPGLHKGVVCDNCNRIVVGFRYKCVTCEDFDLCSACECRHVHAEHCFVRIPNPQMPLEVVKDSIKKSRLFLKSFAASLHDTHKRHASCSAAAAAAAATTATAAAAATAATAATSGPIPNLKCPMKHAHSHVKLEAKLAAKERREERREERHEKRQEKHEKRQERREEVRRERQENPHERIGWMDIFSKYMDQFANLAADHVRVASSDTAEQAAGDGPRGYGDTAEIAKMINTVLRSAGAPLGAMGVFEPYRKENDAQNTAQDSTQVPTEEPAPAPSTPVATQVPKTPHAPTQAPTTQQVPAHVSTTPLVPTQAPTAPQMPTPAAVTPQVAVNPVKVVEDPKTEDQSDASSESSSQTTSRGASPDKSAEDWTMINNDKELDADTGAPNPVQIDSNLPEEFQPRPDGAYGFIYPPLNAATAVYNPEEPVPVAAKSQPPTAPSMQPKAQAPQGRNGFAASTKAELETTAQAGHAARGPGVQAGFGASGQGFGQATQAGTPGHAMQSQASAPFPGPSKMEQRHHRVPHIDAAIRQMIAMGFTNEGGWLTQLVESKDGNIAAVLDLLTPVNPRKK